MNTHITTPRHFRLYGAVLAMTALLITLLAVTLTAGPAMALEPRIGDNTEEYKKPFPCSEEAVPDANTAKLIRDGYYAVFDGFWDYEVGHLSNNFCPPEVTHDIVRKPGRPPIETFTRSDANIHISETVFSIPDSYKVTVVDSRRDSPAVANPSTVAGPTIDIADFLFLAENNAVSATKTENGATVFANNTLYWVRLDQPWTSADETSPLEIGFSTALMEEADWHDADGGAPVQFRFAAVHVLKYGTPQEAHVLGAHMFAFDQRTENTPIPATGVQWSNVETADASEINMQTGKYLPMQFAFTKPGKYLVQAQVQGHVREEKDRLSSAPEKWKPISPDKTITSPVQWYTFHVGSEADLDVALAAGAVSTTEGVSTVPITVSADNAGPNGAENVEVEINLPKGLTLPSTLPAGVTSNECGVIVWKPEGGRLGRKSGALAHINANVAPGAAGKLTATAEIRSTTFDPDTANNASSVEVTLSGTKVRPPFFPGVSRTIVEHAVAGAHAGDPVAANNPDGRALSYSLSGPCSNKFQVHSNGQIVLAAGHTLDYGKQWEYPLTLHVSDGVNASGEADTSIDDSTPVLIRVEDTQPGAVHPTVTFTLSNPNTSDQPDLDLDHLVTGYTVNINAHLHNLPAGAEPTYFWEEDRVHYWKESTSWLPAQESGAGDHTYKVHIKWDGGGITASYTVEWFSS